MNLIFDFLVFEAYFDYLFALNELFNFFSSKHLWLMNQVVENYENKNYLLSLQ